jgi:hypothetical protein
MTARWLPDHCQFAAKVCQFPIGPVRRMVSSPRALACATPAKTVTHRVLFAMARILD